MRSVIRACCTSSAILASLLAASHAGAQGLPLDRFSPAPAGDPMFGVPSPSVVGHLVPRASVLFDYAHNPLVIRSLSTGASVGTAVSSQLFLHVNASLSLWDRVGVDIDIPLALYQAGTTLAAGGQRLVAPDSAQFGEIRLGSRLRLYGAEDDALQVGLGGYLWLPTGPSGSYMTDGNVHGMPQLLLGGHAVDRLVWSFAAGPEIRATQNFAGVTEGTQVNLGAGVGFLFGERRQLQIGPEAYAAFTAATTTAATNTTLKRASNAEILLDVRYRITDDVQVGIGAGPGIAPGVGTPDFRGVLMAAYSPVAKKVEPPPPDRDGDGILDIHDACPDVKGVSTGDPKTHGCPADRDGDGVYDAEDACPDLKGVKTADPKTNGCPADRDGDGIVDAVDACPDEKGVPSEDKTLNGCPADRDGDGIPDAVDACPDVKGPKSADPKENGCPPDTDGDGIRDDKDACPTEKGSPNADPAKNGCPTVHVKDDEIIILEQVQFDTAKDTIKKESDPLLDKVAGVFKQRMEITKVEVQGHTDNQGAAPFNKALSQRRAEAVRRALMKRGIAAGRMIAKGYGQTVPVGSNDTDAGRTTNRRVQFKILAKGASATK